MAGMTKKGEESMEIYGNEQEYGENKRWGSYEPFSKYWVLLWVRG